MPPRSHRPSVAFIGLGRMGGPMADGVARGGVPLRVFDLSGDCMGERVAVGAVAGESSVEAASGADILCVVVHDDGQVLDLVDRAVLEVMAPDGIVVLHSTVTLATVRTVDERCRAHGRHFVDVGISGGAGGAADGTLVMIAGGEDAVLDRVVPILDCYSRKLVRCGPVGAGMAAKVARNLMALSVMALAVEGIALAEAAGVDAERLAEIVEATDPFGYGPRVVDGSMLTATRNQLASVRTTGLKDLVVAAAMAADLGIESSSTDAAIRGWDRLVDYLGRPAGAPLEDEA